MGHGIEKRDKMIASSVDKDGMSYAAPWHGLGTVFEEERLLTSQEAMEGAGLDWQVGIEPIYLTEGIEVPGKHAMVRKDIEAGDIDRYLGVVGNYYEPFQNIEAFDFMDSIVGDGQASYTTAGSLFGGRKVWMLCELPDHVIVADDMVQKYLLLTHQHDGEGMIEVLFTPIRVVCNNTLSAALGNYWGAKTPATRIKVRHTKAARAKLEMAKKTIGIASSYFEKVGEAYNDMQAFEMKDAILQKYFETIVPDPKPRKKEDGEEWINPRAASIRERFTEIFETSPAIVGTSAEGNLWGAFNAITEYTSHEKKVAKTTPGGIEFPEADRKFDKTMCPKGGGILRMRDDAFKEALNLLKN